MKVRSLRTKLLLGALLSAMAISGAVAAPAANAFTGDRVTVDSGKPFDKLVDSVKSLVAKNGMMIMAEVDQGRMLSMTGLSLKATLFLVGNPTIGKQLFEQNHGVGLYVPLRLFVFADEQGKSHLAYDKPSTLLSQFGNEELTTVGQMLDQKLDGLATMAAQ
jgi:uncharacterized protein (DUF302 family)